MECTDYHEVAQAITDMVTQSAGPYTAVGMGMALAAWQQQDRLLRETKNWQMQRICQFFMPWPAAFARSTFEQWRSP